MLLVMFVTFFTSRVVLEALGVDGYGVYSLVGGLAFSFGFFSSSLSNATQRYLSFAHGKDNINEVKIVFNATAILYLLIGGVTLTAGCIIGPLLISKLKIPEDMINASYWIYYCCIISLSVTLTATMFDSVLIARENMKTYAYISIFEVIGKLAIAYLIFIMSHKLIVFAIATMVLTLIVKGFLIFFCITRYQECRIRLHWDKNEIKELTGFIGWNGVGTAVFAINEQGINILLNIFFGPVVNAARGIANQVSGSINHFSSNFLLAISPQMMKSYAKQDMTKFLGLFNNSGKYSFALLWLLFLPILLRRNYILHLWLTDVPDYSAQFLLWIIIYTLVNIYQNPQWFAIQAVGKIRKFVITSNILTLTGLPISWVCLKNGYSPIVVFQVMVLVRILIVSVTLNMISHYIPISIPQYIKKSILPNIFMVAVSVPIAYYINISINQSFIGLIINSSLCMLINTVCIWYIVLSSNERGKLITYIRNWTYKISK
ncbi:MAG: hypothetical protein HDP34_00740 [Clostridia bacterium]|nr:hypothetical protein [Clostridia bacterium]